MKTLEQLIEECRTIALDLNFNWSRKWKEKEQNRLVVGYMPIYFPREIVHAASGLPVGFFGGGDQKQIIKGDAYYQSYICHIPRSTIELVLDGHTDHFDGYVFPSICDVIRNLSGIFRTKKIGKFIKYLDLPQNFLSQVGGRFYQKEMSEILEYMRANNGIVPGTDELNHSISLYNENRKLIESVYDIRDKSPWRLSMEDTYYILRAGTCMPVEEHNEILKQVLQHIQKDRSEPQDRIRIIVSGAFCEQPSVGLIRAIEQAGCYVVDDDYMLGSRMILGDVDDNTNDPLNALAEAYINQSQFSSSIYDVHDPKEYRLAKLVEKRRADGVVFAAPSFCDPALLDAPIFQTAFDKLGIRYIAFQYSENINQFKVIKEQVGAFSDSIKLWEDEVEMN